jgi:hypothetical protein
MRPAGHMSPVDWFSEAVLNDYFFRFIGAIFPTVKEMKF